jgi:diguanylate cyclase (GGDEF)-like protein
MLKVFMVYTTLCWYNPAMPKLMLLDQDRQSRILLEERICIPLNLELVYCNNTQEAVKIYRTRRNEFLAAVCFIGLVEDLPNYCPFENLPTVILTRHHAVHPQKMISSKDILDFLIDLNSHHLEYLAHLLIRLSHNQDIKILIADDLDLTRRLIRTLLTNNRFTVLEAKDGLQAVKIIEEHPDIRLVIMDYQMPKMDGFEVTLLLRSRYTKDRMAILGMSSQDDKNLPVRFLRIGANDYIHKPFNLEEFQCRVMQNIHYIESMQMIRDVSNKDFLSGLFNRKYFLDVGQKYLENSLRNGLVVCVAMIDIDFFKKINDDFGHDAGDLVIGHLARLLQKMLRQSDLVCRYGGEEFCIFSVHKKGSTFATLFHRIQQAVAQSEVAFHEHTLRYTISIGVASKERMQITEMITHADHYLYEAKNTGRNKVILEQPLVQESTT